MATNIHATAIVEPTAQLGEDCSVGAYTYVGSQVRLGARTILQSHVVVDGPTELGTDCEVFPFACLGKRTQDLKYRGGSMPVVIGDRTTIRESVTIHQPTAEGGITKVGNDCSLLAYCHVAHDCTIGDRVIVSNSTNFAGHVQVDDAAVIGGMCGVHQFTRIGRLAMLSAMSKAVQDIPPFCLADGNPAGVVSINKIGLERNGIDKEISRHLGNAFRDLFRSRTTRHEALIRLRADMSETPEIRQLIDFIEHSERGIAAARTRKKDNGHD